MDNKTYNENECFVQNKHETIAERGIVINAMYGVIAFLSFTSNFLLCLALIKKRKILKTSHDFLIFSLAFTDALTGLFIVITPNYVINLSSYSVPDGIAGDVFCRLIFSKFFIFTFGKVSVLTITCLAVERWFALTRRWKYQASFSRKNLYRYITFIWLVSMLAQSYKLFYVRFSHRSCFFIPLSSLNRNVEIAVVIIYVSVTFFVPTIITWAAFFHTYVKLYKSQALKENRGRKEKHLLLKMCAIASLMLTLCWFPTEVSYVINQFGFPVLNFGTPFREFTVALALANSIVNPWIYVVLDRKYRCLIMGVFR